ncbi:MAG: hypothetical protein K6E84_02385 [Lachnospiraceae bacterium]|nr:hypothetical protein [Lachnospiraceae bacterium]
MKKRPRIFTICLFLLILLLALPAGAQPAAGTPSAAAGNTEAAADAASSATLPKAPKKTKITKVSKGKYYYLRGKKIRLFTVKWKKVKGATSYEVYARTGSKKYRLVDTVKKTKSNLYGGVGYRYSIYVVPCRTEGKKTARGKKSKKVTVDLRW